MSSFRIGSLQPCFHSRVMRQGERRKSEDTSRSGKGRLPLATLLSLQGELVSVTRTSHGYASGSRHALYRSHARHGGRGEIGGTIGTEHPAQLEQAFALGAGPLQLLPAGWADLEVRLDTRVAIVAGLALGHLRQQGLFFQLALVNLGQRLARA